MSITAIKNRFTGKVMCGGLSLELVIERHKKWLRGEDECGFADLSGADLRGADLRGADLRGVPKVENIHQAVYAAASQPNALEMGDVHTCETTHCRAGWVVHLAGEAGAAMEWCIGWSAAASLIYLKSDPTLERIPDFYASNEDALADMKRLAELEKDREVICQ